MTITLFALNGSWAHSALGIRCLSAALREAGFAPACVEGTINDRSLTLLETLYRQRASLYAFSCYIWNIEPMLALAEQLKALLPESRIVLGGPEVSFDTERFTALPFVDCVITGEGEVAIVEAARAVAGGRALPKCLIGTPDPDFEHRGIHYTKNEPVSSLVYYESSRGCPFSCSFCLSGRADSAHAVRAKSAKKALQDLLEFEQLPGSFTVKLVDRTFNFDCKRAKEIWRGLLAPQYTKCYHFEIAAHLLDEECFEILSQFPKGKIRLEIGLQSTNAQTLAAISRHTDAECVLQACKRLMEGGGCHVHLDLIAGLPHEDYQSLAHSFDAAYPHCHVLQLGFLKLLHGTPLREQAAAFGAVCMPKSPYTVLKTELISFEEMAKLHRISDLMERLRDSARFSHSLPLILSHLPSPFAFFANLDTYLQEALGKPLQKTSQRDLFWHLSQFARSQLPESVHEALSLALRADYAAAEVRRAPRGL